MKSGFVSKYFQCTGLNKAILAIVILIGFSSIALAQATSDKNVQDSTFTLTEDDAVSLALQNSRKLKSLDTSVAIRKNRLDSSTGVANPELRIKDISTKYFSDSFDEITIGMRWKFPGLGDLSLKKQQAKVRHREAQVDKDIAILELCRKVRKTYADIIYYQRQAEIFEERVEIEKQRIKQIEKMSNIGRRSIVYFAKSKMWLEDAKSESAKIKKRLTQAQKKLQRYTNITGKIKLVLNELPEITNEESNLVLVANENRSELGLFRERMLLAEKEYNMQRYKLIPWFSYIEADYHLEYGKADWGELMIGIELPLFNFNSGNIEATRLSIDRKQIKLDAVKEDIATDLTRALNVYKEYLLDWKTGKVNAEKIIVTVNQIITENKQHETIPVDEVIELERTVLDTKQKMAKRRHDLAHSLYDLYFSLGIRSSKEI